MASYGVKSICTVNLQREYLDHGAILVVFQSNKYNIANGTTTATATATTTTTTTTTTVWGEYEHYEYYEYIDYH